MSVKNWELSGHRIKGQYFASDETNDMPRLLKAAAKWAKQNSQLEFMDISFRQSEGTDLGDSITVYYDAD